MDILSVGIVKSPVHSSFDVSWFMRAIGDGTFDPCDGGVPEGNSQSENRIYGTAEAENTQSVEDFAGFYLHCNDLSTLERRIYMRKKMGSSACKILVTA